MQTLQLLWSTSPAIAVALAVQFVTGIYCVFSSERIIWPDSLCALLVERRRGVEHEYDNSKVVGIAGSRK